MFLVQLKWIRMNRPSLDNCINSPEVIHSTFTSLSDLFHKNMYIFCGVGFVPMVLSFIQSGKVYFSFKLWISCVNLACLSRTLHIFALYWIRSLALSEQITGRLQILRAFDWSTCEWRGRWRWRTHTSETYSNTLFAEGLSEHQHLLLLTHTHQNPLTRANKRCNPAEIQESAFLRREHIPTFL